MRNYTIRGIAMLLILTGAMYFLPSCQKDQLKKEEESAMDNSQLQKNFEKYEVVTLDFDKLYQIAKSEPTTPVSINLNIKAHPDWTFDFTVDEHNKDLFENCDFATVESGDIVVPFDMETIYGLRARLPKADNASTFMFSSHGIEAEISDGKDMYFLERANVYDPSLADNLYVLYKLDDVKALENYTCDMEDMSPDLEMDANTPLASNNQMQLASHTRKCDVYSLGDYQLYKNMGRNTGRCFSKMYLRIFWGSKRYYEYNGYNIELRPTHYRQYTSSTSNMPYNPRSSYYLGYWRNHYKYSWVYAYKADVFMLFTGYTTLLTDDFKSYALGKASGYGTVCRRRSKSFAYAAILQNSTTSNNITAHEIAHLMGAYHYNTRRNLMSSNDSQVNIYISPTTKRQFDIMLWNYGHTCIRP